MYQLFTSVLFCSFLLTLGLPDISDDNTQRSDDEDMAYSVHIRPHDIVQSAQGKRSSYVSSLQDEEPPKSPKTSSTPKRRQPATGFGASGQASTFDHEPTTKTVITVEDSEKIKHKTKTITCKLLSYTQKCRASARTSRKWINYRKRLSS